MGKRIGPEARIIALFLALPEDNRRIVLDVIKSQVPSRPKSTASGAVRKSSPKKSAASSAVSTEAAQERASSATSSGD